MTGSFPDADHRCSAFARGNTLTAKLFLVTAFWDRTREHLETRPSVVVDSGVVSWNYTDRVTFPLVGLYLVELQFSNG